jgi:hypothetical protein
MQNPLLTNHYAIECENFGEDQPARLCRRAVFIHHESRGDEFMLFDDEPELAWRRFFRKCDRPYPDRQILVRWHGTGESGGDLRGAIANIVQRKSLATDESRSCTRTRICVGAAKGMSAPENLDQALERISKIQRFEQIITLCMPLAAGDTLQPDTKDDFDDRLRASYVVLAEPG